MKTFKRILAWLVLGICAVIPCVVYTFLLSICHKSSEMLSAFVIADILALGFAFPGFYLPQIIFPSKMGLRYKLVSILNIYFGVVVILFTFAWAIEYSYSAIFILISAINPYSILGTILFVIQRKKYRCQQITESVIKEEPLYYSQIESNRSKLMKRCLAFPIPIFFASISIITNNIIAYILAEKNILAIIMSTPLTIALAIAGFYASQYFSLSEKGLRYKIICIFFAFLGSETLLSILGSLVEETNIIFFYAKPEVLLLALLSMFDTYLVFAITLFVLYRKNYNKSCKDI